MLERIQWKMKDCHLTIMGNAKIKLEFAPMFKINRIGAKSRENAAAKE